MDSQPSKPNMLEFFRTIWRNWAALMTGATSIPLTAYSLLVTTEDQRVAWTVTGLSFFFFSIYFVWHNERKKLCNIVDEYAYSLRLVAVNANDTRRLDELTNTIKERSITFNFLWRNTLSRPLLYEVIRIDVNGIELPIGNGKEVISASCETMFYFPPITALLPNGNNPENYQIGCEVLYGPVNSVPTRRIVKKISYTAYPASGHNNFVYSLNHDEPYVVN